MQGLGDTFDIHFLSKLPLLSLLLELRPAAAAFVHRRTQWPNLDELTAAAAEAGARTATGHRLRFVDAPPRRRRRMAGDTRTGPDYELRVYNFGEVQTRLRNWHDFFNALAWLIFPHTKAALNRRQVEGWDPTLIRTREQDRLAMFDEGGVILVGDNVLLFGHALMESLVLGINRVRGMAFMIEENLQNVDFKVAKAIEDEVFKCKAPFPVYDLEQGVIHAGRSYRSKP